MAHSLSAQKRVRQNEAAHARNKWRMKTMRDAIKAFRESIAHGTLEDATKAMRECAKIVDKTAGNGVIHKNQAARRKSRMSAALKLKKTAAPAAAKK